MAKDKKTRPKRTFSLEYKRDIVRQANACKRGELAPLLAREGLTSSLLTAWRREVGITGAVVFETGKARGSVAVFTAAGPGDAGLERRVALWRRQIEVAERIIEFERALREEQKALRELEEELGRG